jgi:hypothetical protein
VLRLPAPGETEVDTGVEPTPVLRRAFGEGVGSFTPALGECLERGADYAWTVRALGDETDGVDVDPVSDWSEPLLFRVSPLPSLAEVEQALEVLRIHREAIAGPMAEARSGASRPVRPEVPRSAESDGISERSEASVAFEPDAVGLRATAGGASGLNVGVLGSSESSDALAAGVVGLSTATSGFTFGVLGGDSSSGGAGVGAFATDATGGVGLFARASGTAGTAIDAEAEADTGTAIGILARANAPGGAALKVAHRDPAGGPDILLDGSEQQQTDTVLTESGITRSSADAETFSFTNLGGGSLTLAVDGVQVVTTATDQDTLAGLGCQNTQIARRSGGAWICDVDANSGGDVTSVAAGPGLQGGGAVGDVGVQVAPLGISNTMLAPDAVTSNTTAPGTIGASDIDSGEVQIRIGGTCPPGFAVTGIEVDGSVKCEFLAQTNLISAVFFNAYGSTSIAIGVNGLPLITCQDGSDGSLLLVRCNDPACFGGDEVIDTLDASANGVNFSSLRIGFSGLPVISYYDAIAGALKVVKCNDPVCVGGDESVNVVDGPGNLVGLYNSMAIPLDGLPVISYHDATAGTLKVAKCNDPACDPLVNGPETINIVDGPGNIVGLFTSITIGLDEFPVISYHDETAGALKVAKCNDPACDPLVGGAESINTVDDPATSVGAYSSIVTTNSGLPIIVYQDEGIFSLKVASCNDPACDPLILGPESVTTIDDPGHNVGDSVSVARGPDGRPVVSYRDGVFSDLKVAKCNDPACLGGDETLNTVDDPPLSPAGESSSIAIGKDGLPIISHLGGAALRVVKCASASCG